MISESALDRLQHVLGEPFDDAQGRPFDDDQGRPDLSGTRYELAGLLGRGGMGVVYLARDTSLDREVALKVLDWTSAPDPRDAGSSAAGFRASGSAAPRDLEEEARILARLEHPGIVPVHDVGRLADGRLFYAMKRVRGERLDRWAGGAGLHARLAVFLRICETVAFAHAHGVIHRDLKPENVMVGEFGEVLVLDWGVARCRNNDKNPRETAGHAEDAQDKNVAVSTSAPSAVQLLVVGTPDYMAPEQARGDSDSVDERADIYALGAILAGLADRSRALDAIVAKARSADRHDRYATATALAADVERFMSGLAVGAHRETVADRVMRLARRYRVPIALVLTYLAMRLLLFLTLGA